MRAVAKQISRPRKGVSGIRLSYFLEQRGMRYFVEQFRNADKNSISLFIRVPIFLGRPVERLVTELRENVISRTRALHTKGSCEILCSTLHSRMLCVVKL